MLPNDDGLKVEAGRPHLTQPESELYPSILPYTVQNRVEVPCRSVEGLKRVNHKQCIDAIV
jgi:hypothetical protein